MRARAWRVAGLLVLASSSAWAAPGEARRAGAAAPSGGQAARERTVEAKRREAPAASARREAPSARAAPPAQPKIPEALRATLARELEARVGRNLASVKRLRDEGIALLTAFIAESPREAREMPEALIRLGELRWELEREALAARFKAWEAKPAAARGPAPEPNYQPSRELFARVLRDYPGFRRYDLALYVDGFLAYEQGKEEEALVRFDRILSHHPRSPFVPDAHMARAEALFNGSYDYAGALVEYDEVLAFDTELSGLAMFKSAWCLWRLGRSDEAAKRFVAVFEMADAKASGADRRQLDELESEALKYLVEVFTEDEKNTAQDVYAFLEKTGGDRFAGKIVRALAVEFYDQAKFERGIQAYELLLELEPSSRDAGRWVLAIASGYGKIDDFAKLQASYQRAATGYTDGSAWARAQGDPKAVAGTSRDIERQLRENAIELHARGQRSASGRAELEAAAALYAVYLSKFAGAADAYQVDYHLAEIYFWRLDQPTLAAKHYMSAARAIPSAAATRAPLGALRRDAIYNALAALERVRAAELEARKGKPKEAYQETEADETFAEALELYAQLYPEDPALPELFFRHGSQYYEYGVYDAAVKIWGSLLERFPRSESALAAGERILDSFHRANDYENIETWARRLKKAPAFAGDANQKKLESLIVQSVFKQGEQRSQAGDHLGAAKAYLRAAKEFPSDARAAQACVNAALSAQKAGDLPALRESARLVTGEAYRDRPESPQGAWIAATTFQSMGLLEEAAELNEAIAALAGRDLAHYRRFSHAQDAAFNAVLLRAATGDHDKAIANGDLFLSRHGASGDADEVVFQMGKAHQSAGRDKQAADLYRRYLARSKSQDHRAQGYVLLARALMKTGDGRGADEALRSAVEIGKRRAKDLGPEGKYAAAHARYMEGERVLAKFEAIEIQGDEKQLGARLKQKAELLRQASTVFLDVLSFGVAEWTTAALYQIGRAYETFASSLRDSPAPSGLSDADKAQYELQIDEFVVPIEERAIDAYESGWEKAIELGIYNRWTERMRAALGELNAEMYPPFKETGFEVRSRGPAPLPPLIDAPRRGAPAKASGAPAKRAPAERATAKGGGA